jgi:hypothetical protein
MEDAWGQSHFSRSPHILAERQNNFFQKLGNPESGRRQYQAELAADRPISCAPDDR